MNMLESNILELVKDCRLIGISGHENPDGDCVGSCCAMAMYLRKAMPDAEIRVYLEEFDEALVRCIPGAESVRHDLPESGEVFDAFIALDSTPDRMGPVSHFFDSASVKINIDHHVTNSGCGTYNYINGKASSACELVYELMDRGSHRRFTQGSSRIRVYFSTRRPVRRRCARRDISCVTDLISPRSSEKSFSKGRR